MDKNQLINEVYNVLKTHKYYKVMSEKTLKHTISLIIEFKFGASLQLYKQINIGKEIKLTFGKNLSKSKGIIRKPIKQSINHYRKMFNLPIDDIFPDF